MYRPLYKALVDVGDVENKKMISRLKDGVSLGELVDSLSEGFDFERWLSESVEKRIVLGVYR